MVYTDVMQTLLMFCGVIIVVVVCCIDLGGVGNVWAAAEHGERLEFFKCVFFLLFSYYMLHI